MSVYFIQAGAGGPIKIGYAMDVLRRLRALQSGHYLHLYIRALLPGDVAVERALRRRFVRHLIRGEWFRPDPELIAFLVAAPPLPEAVLRTHEVHEMTGCRRYHCRILRAEGGYETFDMRV